MTLRVGVFPHADLPHIVPSFRICRELLGCGHEVRVLGSDVRKFGRGHSEAWADQLGMFGLNGREVVHRSDDVTLAAWLEGQLKDLRLDVLVVDAVWQGLAYGCRASLPGKVVVHHAGLPDFRSSDMPTWDFVHPGHPRERWALARRSSEQREQSGEGVRGLLSSVKALSAEGRKEKDVFGFGCGEFENLPATRAMSLCPAVEFPDERGRVEYFGTLLPAPGDIDWRALPPELADADESLVACAFGTTGLRTRHEYDWLLALATRLAHHLAGCRIVAVVPAMARRDATGGRAPKNLVVQSWVPLWELLSGRKGAKVLVSTPGVGAFREAVASGTPVVAVPRWLDQFGAAARVEYFGVGHALVSHELPEPDLVVKRVASVLHDSDLRARTESLRQEVAAFDATRPLKRFIERTGHA
ncbi:Oleandomycin glycosyltransferase [Rhizobiaceae bacterium]|nr:Oleandomycin glycosyltransferase [Rhizobiaceae bacterium]